MYRVPWVALLAVGCLAGAWAADAPAEDPWKGKTRADVTALLGEPTKTKTSGDGTEALTYKLYRLHEDAVPPPEVMVLNVPGIGVVGQMQQLDTLGAGDVALVPDERDRKGRGTGGGVGSGEESYSVEYDPKSGEVTRSWEEKPAFRGKVTLKFQVSGDGSVESWSVSPKKAASGR
jgi:hypothetical protein